MLSGIAEPTWSANCCRLFKRLSHPEEISLRSWYNSERATRRHCWSLTDGHVIQPVTLGLTLVDSMVYMDCRSKLTMVLILSLFLEPLCPVLISSSTTMAAASPSSDDSQIKHDVFISFSGKDTRRGFLSHVVKELRREKIIVYVDENLNRGEEISSSLLRAIQESQISIVIFSEKYASSRWCLDELAEIIKCMKVNKQIILPVFYYIDPSHVRHQKGTYENAFADHELKFQGNGLKVQNWRSALKNAADISGYDSSSYCTDSELVDEIVKDVLSRLNHVYPSEPIGLVGIDQHIDRIRSFLEMESKEVQILGIWGMSGIGKTTIAQHAHDKFYPLYEGSYFLENVREESQKHGLKYLKQKLFSGLQEDKSTSVHKRLLSRRKVFVVLDDVDTPEQLQHLVIEGIRLGPRSRVIVTTRNKHVLEAGGVHDIYEVKELDFERSLELFSLNAFKKSHPDKGYEELSKRAVAYAEGLPLALKVWGTSLYSGDKETWKDTLRKLEMYPHPRIQDVLKISYDGLDDVERDLFLDIAFFYNGEDKDHVMSLLDANNLFPAGGIKVLLDKALISISNDNIIQMCGLLQEMGWEIVRQECKENPGKRSRLKDFEEVYDVLKNNKGTNAIKGIALCASLFRLVQFNVDTFKDMTNLRVVKFYSPWHVRSCNVHHPTSFDSKERDEHSTSTSNNKILLKRLQLDYDISRSLLHLSDPSVELHVISKVEKIEWKDIYCCESCGNVNPYNFSLSMIVALNLVCPKDSKTLHSEGNFRFLSRNYDVSFSCSVKEFLLSSKDISDPDLRASKFKMLCSSMGRINMPRRIIQGGSRQEILPIHESCCRQMMSQIPNLRTLIDAFLYKQELFMRQEILYYFIFFWLMVSILSLCLASIFPVLISSSDDSQIKHDVFISFSGKDTRCGFLSHLLKELRREKIIVYVDENLNRGEEISSSLLRAIQESRISIVIFSEKYASSRCCLDELAEIIKCMKVNKQIILPVFYSIDPSHVRHQKGTYENAFADHDLKFQGNGLKVQNWRSALKNAAELSGYDSSNYCTDSELVDEIVKDVLSRLDHVYPSEPIGLVGIDQHFDCIRSFLEMESKEVQILEIWGMGGIGKTTIAQVAYGKFSPDFEGSCFLENVREESQKHGLKSLKQKLISELQEDNSTSVQKRLLSRRKVFVVLDDVDTLEQLHHLVTEGICLGPGSRVIVTSRTKYGLKAGGVHDIHEVKGLDFEESLKLFSLNAFKKSHPEKGYEELSRRAVAYAKGIPLALKVLGLCLYCEDKETWKDTLRKLKMRPHPLIQDVLKISYDGLDDVERDIFLHIAFFYRGEDKDHVMSLLDANKLFPAHGIKGLLDKALISISNDNTIQMHDLIKEMGWEIVRQECKENPGKSNRLKGFEECMMC